MGIVKAWSNLNLIWRICIGLLIGAILGVAGNMGCMPEGVGTFLALLGTLFTTALKSLAPILVFFLVISALVNSHIDRSMGTVVVLYVCGTFMAAVLAVIASYISPTALVLTGVDATTSSTPSDIGTVLTTLLTNLVANPVSSISNALTSVDFDGASSSSGPNYLGILFWSILLGIALRRANLATKEVFNNVAEAITTIVRWVISCAPFGILGLVYDAVATSGLEIFTVYGHLVLVLVVTMLVFALIANPILVGSILKCNPYPLVFRTLKDSAVTAFFTRSSAANIPVNMSLCEKLGLDKKLYSVSIPLGATVNMGGAAVTITVMTMAAATTMGIEVHPVQAVILSVLAAVSACGASGVPGGSLMLIPLACSLFGISADISAQVIAVGFIIAVIQDSLETALNSSTDVLFTATADYRRRRKLGISFAPGKDAPVPVEFLEQEQEAAEAPKAENEAVAQVPAEKESEEAVDKE